MRFSGRTALVTGASAGIGACFARALAQEGADVIVTARRADRLAALAASLEADYGVRCLALPADLADPSAPARLLDGAQAHGMPVDILVNNAGYGLPGYFTDTDWAAQRDVMQVLAGACAELAHRTLPGMKARGYGRIINVASLAGLTPGAAGHTLYGPTKAFLVSLSQSLAAECAGTGVHVCALCPGFTMSEFHDANGTRRLVALLPRLMMMAPEPVVAEGLKAVEDGRVVAIPGLWNKSVSLAMKLLPRSAAARLVQSQTRRFRRRHAGP